MNWLSGSDGDHGEKETSLIGKAKEIVNSENQKKRLISEFKYFYDEVIFLYITRYEFGLWIIFAIFFLLRKALQRCGVQKTVFDFMRQSEI